MVNTKHALSLVTLSVALVLGAASAFAADPAPASKPATQLVTTYSTFAGSNANATALVDGLRTGSSITLTSSSSTSGSAGTPSTTFTPATSKLGYGNVNIALALAQAELTKLGITDPTPVQLQAALNGGTVTTSTGPTTLSGVLQLRSEGKGWGAIAKSLGFNLGAVVSASKTDRSAAGTERQASDDKGKPMARADKANSGQEAKVDRIAKVERVAKVDRPERIERPEKVERPERVERPKR